MSLRVYARLLTLLVYMFSCNLQLRSKLAIKNNMASRISALSVHSQKLKQFKPTNILSTINACSYSDGSEHKVTHTGQVFDKDDIRMVRFVDRPKLVNPNFSIDLINQVAPTVQKDRIVSCDGGGGPLGHPKVYINLDKPGNHTCGYCGLRFYKEDHHH